MTQHIFLLNKSMDLTFNMKLTSFTDKSIDINTDTDNDIMMVSFIPFADVQYC